MSQTQIGLYELGAGQEGTVGARTYDILINFEWSKVTLHPLIRSQVGRSGGGAIFNTLKWHFEAQIGKKLRTSSLSYFWDVLIKKISVSKKRLSYGHFLDFPKFDNSFIASLKLKCFCRDP